MSAIFGEKLTFPQEKGQEVKSIVYGDEFYAQYETEEGYSVVYDRDLGLFCYALLKEGAFFSRKIPISKSPPQICSQCHINPEKGKRLMLLKHRQELRIA
jgi:hypothetical protein